MSLGFVLALAVLLGGYAFLYKMVALWSGRNVSFHQSILGGCV